MSNPFRIVIVGAGPAGLSAAIAIAQHPSSSAPSRSVHITVLELRPGVQTIGGAVNMTPLALHYLDALGGAGARLRPRGHAASAIELVAHRTGRLLATLWPGVDALRVRRQDVVEALTEAAVALGDSNEDPDALRIVYGARVEDLAELDNGGVRVTYTREDDKARAAAETIEADLVLGCDGIHSIVRRRLVEPDRPETYTGKCVAYGFLPATAADAARWTRAGGQPLVRHTTLVQHGAESLLLARHQPAGDDETTSSESSLYVAVVMPVPPDEAGDRREGRAVRDKDELRRAIADRFAGGAIDCLGEVLARCDDWFFYPVRMLPDGGAWSEGHVLLLGDAAHAMPPQGESTGVAIEDGVLVAHVLSRRGDGRDVSRMIADYEALRRADVAALHRTSMARWNGGGGGGGWLGRVVMEWMAWVVVSYLNWTSDHFARDVRNLPLPE
ncbi:salicylate hydroxylase [Cordyceps fumosorosea ARSEF 2679]|uniref:Salicylate hydroxylase n=1 Tax=Cordyceps fumosorosea (strain ARSEF 2679) TaxID=1081104 RepID=A0A168AP86_CORFA|nr:salicylate hydroxylase [Cordyceps fumosorosea ARSEF 2679]OAA69007.1 salicylate hydroxylase [Cordyceps fumosorosea ARSEF 2679]